MKTSFEKAVIFSNHLLEEASKSKGEMYESGDISKIDSKVIQVAVMILRSKGHMCSASMKERFPAVNTVVLEVKQSVASKTTPQLVFYQTEELSDNEKIAALCKYIKNEVHANINRGTDNRFLVTDLQMFSEEIVGSAAKALQTEQNWSVEKVFNEMKEWSGHSIKIDTKPIPRPVAYDPDVLFA